jgi:hypothetical protein
MDRSNEGIDYDQTFAPVATWESIRLCWEWSRTNGRTKQLDYVLAFPQAPVDRECFMKMPLGITDEPGEWALRVKYLRPETRRKYVYLIDKLVNEIGFTQSRHDECVFYRGNVIYLLYTDDSILAGPDEDELNDVVEDIKAAGLTSQTKEISKIS